MTIHHRMKNPAIQTPRSTPFRIESPHSTVEKECGGHDVVNVEEKVEGERSTN